MSNYAKSDWQMTVTLHSSDSLFLYTSFCGVLVRHDKRVRKARGQMKMTGKNIKNSLLVFLFRANHL